MRSRERVRREGPTAQRERPLDSARTRTRSSTSDAVHELQEVLGNRAVTRLLRSSGLGAGLPSPSRPLPTQRAWVQPKLRVGPAGDRYERQADQVADHVMRHRGAIAGTGIVARDEDLLQPSRTAPTATAGPVVGAGGGPVGPGIEREIARARGGGRPLPTNVRTLMEQALQADLSPVRVHSSPAADSLNRSLQSSAFTVQRDIFFARGQYRPDSSSGQRLLAHELTHTLQQGAVAAPQPCPRIQRRLRADLRKDEFVAALEADAKKRSKLDWIPTTGLGRFDAEYLPSDGELKITIRVLFDFCQKVEGGKDGGPAVVTPGGWTKKERYDFFDQFKAQAEAAWAGKYTFSCTKAGWEDLTAKVVIDVQPAKSEKKAHFRHRIQKEKKMGTGIGREQGDQTRGARVINVGNFAEQDAPERPHDSAATCAGIASHDMSRLQNLIAAYQVNPVRFVGGGKAVITPESRRTLDAFAQAVQETERPGSVPVPILVNGKENRRERRKKGDNSAQQRAGVVVAYLNGKHLRNPAQAGKFTDVVETQEAVYKSKKSKLSKEAEKAKLDPLKARQDHREAELDVDLGFVWGGDAYSILAHEFGHMLGNPDEYFEYGSEKIRDKKVAQLIATGRPEDALRAQHIAVMKPTGNESHTQAQESYGKLAEKSGQQIPEFGPKTSSIMSAGADVLPVHYAPLWEVLSAITAESITPEEWKIT